MSSRTGRVFVLVVVPILFLAMSSLSYGSATDGVPCSNPHLATQQEADAAPNGGIVAGVTDLCSDAKTLGISDLVGSAKEFLNSVPKRCVGACAAPPDKAHIDKLNNTFAVCAANFIKAYTLKYGAIYISSAYRDGPSGENARAGGAPNSNHTKGLAIDMSPASGDFPTMWKFASQNPGFGVCFPYLGSDRPHMSLAGSGTGEASKCAAQGVTAQCTGAPTFTPTAASSGAAGLYDESGQLYGNTAAGPAASTPYTALPSTSYPGAPVPTVSTQASTLPATTQTTQTTSTGASLCTPAFSCSNNVMYYQTTSCTTQVYQTCTSGCNGNSCATIAPSTGTSTLVVGTSTVQASSTMDLLNSLSSNVSLSATPIGTATPLALALNGNTSDVTGLGGKTSTSIVNPGTIASIQPITSQQTFTSTDLGTSGTYTGTVSPQSSGLSKILSDLHAALTWALGYLRSLRGA